ncbi:MAG: GIY-YIG nuclease family protein [Anaerolineaceae bacterium]
MAYYCYILECANGAYYTGWTKDPARRLKQHNAGHGARYTRLNGPARLVYVEEVPDHISALKREAEIKSWDHARKGRFVRGAANNLAASFFHDALAAQAIQPEFTGAEPRGEPTDSNIC